MGKITFADMIEYYRERERIREEAHKRRLRRDLMGKITPKDIIEHCRAKCKRRLMHERVNNSIEIALRIAAVATAFGVFILFLVAAP